MVIGDHIFSYMPRLCHDFHVICYFCMSNKDVHFRTKILPIPSGSSHTLWSVMIPTYNCAKFLSEALESVLVQAPGPDVMHIEVVDDCSTLDDPEAVVKAIGKGRVKFYRHPQNVGHIRNFNTCIKRSQGRLVHILHGDDRVHPGFYWKLQQGFERQPAIGAAFCRHIGISETGQWEWISDLEREESGILENWLEKISKLNRLQTPSMVVRRKVYEELGGFDLRTSYVEDWEMWVRVAVHYPVWYEVEPLAEYRGRNTGSLTKISREKSQIANVRKTTKIMHSYLPKDIALATTRQARENWALYSLSLIESSNIIEKNFLAALLQFRVTLNCSFSLRVLKRTCKLLGKTLAKRLRIILRHSLQSLK